ncbi:MAG TPA: aromatic ring-hydroxylating dioxygenase subunit alpha [Burkholderiales bacterium]|nr:aromatic ring-hydroxylating dioxygenase subunit alpha [Burkholderiales bacterium]
MGFDDYWYVVAESGALTQDRALARCVLNQTLACFRGADGEPTVLFDRCLHRNAPLSAGVVRDGLLSCPYHGWTYDGRGRVVSIPSLAADATRKLALCSAPLPVLERDGYVYVRLKRDAPETIAPFRMPHFGERGWCTLRLQNRFSNNVANCVENFIDIPHTAFVHRGIFRSSRTERLTATVLRERGEVHVTYRNERANLGTYAWFLNPRGREIEHTDSFFAPNVTSVVYRMGAKTFSITSQAVPVTDEETLVYTDLTYAFGVLNAFTAPFVRAHGQRIIDQDIDVLGGQMAVIRRYGKAFRDTPADLIHSLVDSIRSAIARGEDPLALPPFSQEIEFYV